MSKGKKLCPCKVKFVFLAKSNFSSLNYFRQSKAQSLNLKFNFLCEKNATWSFLICKHNIVASFQNTFQFFPFDWTSNFRIFSKIWQRSRQDASLFFLISRLFLRPQWFCECKLQMYCGLPLQSHEVAGDQWKSVEKLECWLRTAHDSSSLSRIVRELQTMCAIMIHNCL